LGGKELSGPEALVVKGSERQARMGGKEGKRTLAIVRSLWARGRRLLPRTGSVEVADSGDPGKRNGGAG